MKWKKWSKITIFHYGPHHVWLGGELVCLQALQGHPFNGQLDSTLVVDAVVLFIINVSGQAEVRHLHRVALIQPVRTKKKLRSLLFIWTTISFSHFGPALQFYLDLLYILFLFSFVPLSFLPVFHSILVSSIGPCCTCSRDIAWMNVNSHAVPGS